MPKESRYSARLPKPVAPYCHAAVANGFAYLSGMLSQEAASGEFVFDAIEDQTRRILTNLRTLVEDLGTDLGSVVKVTIFLRDMAVFGAVNAVYGEFFATDPPARSCVAVAGLPKDADIEIEAVVAL
jgi:2-iminobutanoate/2-iminopropanoate deaminase